MPEVSSGVYIHDFTVNRTAIIEDSRCFVMQMDRNEIALPRSLHELFKNIKEDGYELNLDEVQHEMMIILPDLAKEKVFKEYGLLIGRMCDGKMTYKLKPVPDEFNIGQEIENPIENMIPEILGELGAQLLGIDRQKRSTKEEKTFREISKFSINYKILNYDQAK